MRSAVFLLFALIVLATAQRIDRYTIDDFSLGVSDQEVTYTADVAIDIPRSGTPERSALSSRQYSGCTAGLQARLIGCAREMYIEVYNSNSGRDFISAILPFGELDFPGSWDIASPKAGTADYWIQYDGGDGSYDVDISGLGSVDLTEGGLTDGLRIFAVTDQVDPVYNIALYSPNGGVCIGEVPIRQILGTDYSRADIANDLEFDDFDGDCDRTSVGAIDVLVPSFDGVDAIITQITGIGQPDPSPSPTPAPSASRTPAPSASRTSAPSASRTPAPSNSPSRTPSPSGPCVRFCECPSFTCALLYDDEFSNNDVDLGFQPGDEISDDSDEEIVYVPVPVTVTVPTVTVPTVTVPTVTVPTVTVPTVTVPTVTIPTVTVDFSDSGSSSASTLFISMILIVVAILW